MNRRRWVPAAAASVLALSLVPGAQAAPPEDRTTRGSAEEAATAVGQGRAAQVSAARSSAAAASTAPGSLVAAPRLPGKPRNDVIEDVPVDPADASLPLNLVPYHEFAPRLRALQASERVSVEVIGQSAKGRDLHMVVVTSPMTDAEWAEWQRLSDLRSEDPVAAAALQASGGYDGWKTPLFVNDNIHGNEWEGTDAAFGLLDELAFSEDEAVARLADEHVIAVVVSMNPDGRVAATRANGNGFDMNRDFITQSQAEVRALRDQLIRYEPLTMIDLHGYVARTLIEPTTGPHGENYEYDLYIRNALRNGLAMEAQVVADNAADLAPYYGGSYTAAEIPFRDYTDGWDDWPPIFTPMYAMLHGAVGHTIEFPLNPRGATLTQDERWNRTRINTGVARSAMEANLAWSNENAPTLLADQIEQFRRGEAGEPSRPIDDPLALDLGTDAGDPDDPTDDIDNTATLPQDYPRAYVVPAGEAQRSETAAARVVQFLLDNDVEVHRTVGTTTIGGTRYAAGSYVVDMHQAKRGMANTILDVGEDVTELYPTMYDISAWSLASLWGADVDVVQDGSLPEDRLDEVDEAAATGSVPAGRRPAYVLSVDSSEGVAAVNRLVAEGAEVTRLADGTFQVRADRALVAAVAAGTGVDLTAARQGRLRPGQTVAATRVAAAASDQEVFALRGMGFEVTPVTTAGFNDGTYGFGDFDALYVGTGTLDPTALTGAAASGFSAFLADGGNVVGRGAGGVTFNSRAGLLPVTATAARSDANGIVAVVNDPASPLTGGAPDESFVSSPRYFSGVGAGVRVDQRLATGDFFLAGHWVGQEEAAGQPVVVSGVSAQGAEVALFATEPLYRGHPQGLFPQVAAALWGGVA
ncbi:M14 family zinc carboxypeptidase [Aquipuribacter hungaricus]|uniref:M14 family zinc carboxypeptidase n=1 Tax=Aquipuribacter hungaricus TaxID=545624 RepID=A0ABV7WLX1_9MICO